jgi:hypothetical protein
MSARDATRQFPQCPTVIQSETAVIRSIDFRVTRLRTRLQLEEDRQPCDGYLENALFMVIPRYYHALIEVSLNHPGAVLECLSVLR